MVTHTRLMIYQQNQTFYDDIPNRFQIDRENGHYSSHIIIHPKHDTIINQSTLISSYYRSPTHSNKFSDIKILRNKITHILKHHKQKRWNNNQFFNTNKNIKNILIAGDFNVHNELYSRLDYTNYNSADRLEFKYMDKLFDEKHLSIQNLNRIPTHRLGNVLDLKLISENLKNNCEYYIIKCKYNNNKMISDHYMILSLYKSHLTPNTSPPNVDTSYIMIITKLIYSHKNSAIEISSILIINPKKQYHLVKYLHIQIFMLQLVW
eukprot:476650_1